MSTDECIKRNGLIVDIDNQMAFFRDKCVSEDYDHQSVLYGLMIARNLVINATAVDTYTIEDMQDNYDAGASYEAGKHDKAKGEWIVKGNTTMYYACSKCGSAGDLQDKFCRNCGSDMRNSTSEDDSGINAWINEDIDE